MTRLLGLMLVVLLGLGLAACGDAGDGGDGGGGSDGAMVAPAARRHPAAPVGGSDATRARHALIRLGDMPESWREEPGTLTRIRCGGVAPYRGASVLVSTLRMTHEHDGVQERIAVFPSATAARAGLRRLNSRAAARCLRRTLERDVSEEAGAPASPATLVRLERLGPSAVARRYVSESLSAYGRVVAYIDAVHMRAGRVVAALTFVSEPQPPEEALYAHVVGLAMRRLRAAGG